MQILVYRRFLDKIADVDAKGYSYEMQTEQENVYLSDNKENG